MNPIKSRITQFLVGEEYVAGDDYFVILGESQDLVKAGVENDADAILYACKINKKINVAGIVGKSVIQGPDLKRYLEAYFADSDGFDHHKPKIADFLYNEIKGKTEACMVLKSGGRRWKSFQPIKNIDEVMVGAMDS